MTFIDLLVIVQQFADMGVIMLCSMLSTSSYIFTDKNFINATQVPYYSSLSQTMMDETKRGGLHYIIIMSDYSRMAYIAVALFSVLLQKQTVIFTVHAALIVTALILEITKLTLNILAMVECKLYWYCFTPSKTPVPTPVVPSTEFVVMFSVNIYFVVSLLSRIAIFYCLKKQVKREINAVLLSNGSKKEHSKKYRSTRDKTQ